MIRFLARNASSTARGRVHACVLLVALPLLAGCERAQQSDERAEELRAGGTLVVVAPTDLSQPNGFVAADDWTQEVNRYLLYVPLLRLTPEMEYAPGVAESWEVSDSVATFRLRRDLRWHDGQPTTAEDVVFTLERVMQPETAYPNASFFQRWTSVEAIDSFTVRARYQPHAEPLAGLALTPIMPRHLLDSVPAARMAQSDFNRRPIGNGPFRFVSARSNDRWVFERNPDFPEALGGPPHVERLVWRVVPENTAQIAELRTGEAHLALSPPPAEVAELDSLPGLHAIVKPSSKYAFLAWNGLRSPLDQPEVRRALMMAIDRQQIIDALRDGYGELAAGPLPPHHWAYDESVGPLPYDTAAALRLLEEAAGIADRDGDGTLETVAGEPFSIEIKLPANNAFNRDVAEMIRSDLAEIGVDATTQQLEFNTLIADITAPERRFDAALLGWIAGIKVNLRDVFHTSALGGPFQSASYSNPEVDSLINVSELTVDRDAARPVHRRLQEILRDEQPWGFLFYYPDLFLASDRLKGTDMDIRGAFATVDDWWIEPVGESEVSS